MADKDAVRSFEQIKAYPRGDAQGGRAIQAVKGSMSENDGTGGHRTILRETSEGRAIARTRDRMPMVEVEKRKCELGVDHGTIDILNIAPEHPDSFKNGKLYFTPFVQAHITGAAVDDPYRPIVDEIEPPEDIKGEAPADGADAKSLSKNKKGDNAGAVYTKKLMMGRCPASIFTGRARLYVQAVYGRHDALDLVSLSPTSYSETPSLILGDLTPVVLHTSCGIYFNAATAEHWLICVNGSSVDFYPMQAAECVEELRDFLLDADFPAADKERVETYILSDCAPVVEKKQTVAITATGNSSMGYGWHFNWAGDRCDIVHNDIVAHGGGGYENSSTHYRLTFARNNSGVWSVTRTVVEGPVLWKSLRNVEPIASPNWAAGVLEKFGANIGPAVHGNAPFYVFYDRDEIKVCRYSASTQSYSQSGITREPDYFWLSQYTSVGSDAVNWRTREAWGGITTTISCGGYSVSYQQGSYVDNVYTRESPDPANIVSRSYVGQNVPPTNGTVYHISGQPETVDTTNVYDSYFGIIPRYSGSGGVTGLSGWPIQENEFYGVHLNWGELLVRAPSESFTQSVNMTTEFLTVIPFYDAEAIYLHGKQQKTSADAGLGQIEHGFWYEWGGIVETGSIYVVAGIASDGRYNFSDPEGSYTISRTTTTNSSSSKLICSAGAIDASFPGASGFWTTNDYVAQQYPTYSSASGNSVMAPQNAVDSGNSALTDASIYVGWA